MSTVGLTAAGVERAAKVLDGIIVTTPLEHSARLSEQVGAPVLLKRENRQVARSYKVRGAYHAIQALTPDERARGVVCASAGNHAQGVAVSCAQLGIRGRIYVPGNTPRQKRQRIVSLGGEFVELIVTGSTFDEAGAAAAHDSAETGAVFIHPFNDVNTILGQGTVALEAIAQAEAMGHEVGTVVVPIGGGGLVSGIAVWLKERRPDVRVVGVEPAGAASMGAALEAGHPVRLTSIDTFVDGVDRGGA